MNAFTSLDLAAMVGAKETALFSKATLDKYVTLMKRMQDEIALLAENDEEGDLKKSTLAEAQETAGFGEQNERYALGGLFNNLMFFRSLTSQQQEGPSGDLKAAIEKQFTDLEGFKQAFAKVVD